MENFIETKGLSHTFNGRETVLSDINLQIKKGCIYGFLGQNGAGKTTTLRLLLGLLKKQSGSIQVFGKDLGKNRLDILQGVGSLIEQPSVYGHLSATDNLRVFREVTNAPVGRIAEVLQTVGLTNTGKKKARHFSLGMKQRLGIAMALLHHPQLLILDEPTNGLDPNGIIEIRLLMQRLNKENGITILFSSHLLTEVEKVATHLGIIHQGALVYQGPLEQLHHKMAASFEVRLETDNNRRVISLLQEYNIDCAIDEPFLMVSLPDRESIAWLNETLILKGIRIFCLAPLANNLEQLFQKLTNP